MNLILAVTGATGAHAARLMLEKSPWSVTLVASRWGREVFQSECGSFESFVEHADKVYDNDDLSAPISSGSVPTMGMVILPCSTNMLGKIAGGIADTLISRAAHCHIKERRKLILCVRESPWTSIDLENARRISEAGGIIMPISPPYYMTARQDPEKVTMNDLLKTFVDHVLSVLGHFPETNWETVS